MSNSAEAAPTTVVAPSQDGYITMQALRDFVEATDHYGEQERVRLLPEGLSIDVQQ